MVDYDYYNAEWVARERDRFAQGHYTHPVWMLDMDLKDVKEALHEKTQGAYHFPHVSLNNASMVAYTPDISKGEADRQVPIKVGRYINRFQDGSLDENRIREVVERHNSAFDTGDLNIATTDTDIELVYTSGPSSCMSHQVDDYSSNIHPTRVYGSNANFTTDTAIAWVGSEGKPRGRALIHLHKKIYSTIYGDKARLGAILDKSGYQQDEGGGFEGAKIQKISHSEGEDNYVLPYLDNSYGVWVRDDHLEITEQGGDFSGESTHGLTQPSRYCCCCDDDMHEDDAYYNDNGESYCEDCWHEHYTYCCSCDESYFRDDVYYIEGHGDYCHSCFDDNGFVCEGCSESCHIEDGINQGPSNESEEKLEPYMDGAPRCNECHGEHVQYCLESYEHDNPNLFNNITKKETK